MDFKVGQKVLFVPYKSMTHSPKGWWTITNIGRKWVYTDRGRFEKNTLQIDCGNYSQTGKLYVNEEDFKEEEYRSRLWIDLKSATYNYTPPKNITTENMRQALKFLTKQ